MVLSGFAEGRAAARELEAGHYRAEAVSTGPGFVRLSHEETTRLMPMNLGEGAETRLEIVLGEQVVSGFVREEGSASPVVEGLIETTLPDGTNVSTYSNPDASYRLEGLPQLGSLKLRASRADFESATRVVEAGTVVADFALRRRELAEVRALVAGRDGSPLRGAQVILVGQDLPCERRGGASDQEGRAAWRVKPGTYQLLARHPGYPPKFSGRFVVTGGSFTEKALSLEKGYHVKLMDRREGDRLEARVRLFVSNGEEIPLRGFESLEMAGEMTDLGFLAAGSYRVRLESRNGFVEKVFFVRDQDIEVEIR